MVTRWMLALAFFAVQGIWQPAATQPAPLVQSQPSPPATADEQTRRLMEEFRKAQREQNAERISECERLLKEDDQPGFLGSHWRSIKGWLGFSLTADDQRAEAREAARMTCSMALNHNEWRNTAIQKLQQKNGSTDRP